MFSRRSMVRMMPGLGLVPATALSQDATPEGSVGSSATTFDVRTFGAVPDGATDSTAAFQEAIDTLLEGGGGTLRFDGGNYVISSPIQIRQTNLVGLGIQGGGRGSTLIQTADNAPHFAIESGNAHSLTVSGFSPTWNSKADERKSARAVFAISGEGSFYNSIFRDLTMSNGHYLIDSSTTLVWGCAFENIQVTDGSGGFYRLKGKAGQPNNRLTSIYVGAQTMAGPIFNGTALNVQMDAVEINQALRGAELITDTAGGNYVVGLLGCEGGAWSREDGRMFNLVSSSLTADLIFAEGTCTARTFLFACESYLSRIRVRRLMLAVEPSGDGRFHVGQVGGALADPNAPHGQIVIDEAPLFYGAVSGWNADDETLTPTHVGATYGADAFRITEWNDAGRISFGGDADVTLTADHTRTNIFAIPLTSDRSVTLPSGNLMWTGRSYIVVRTDADGSGVLSIQAEDGTTLASLPSGRQGRVEVVWNRSLQDGPFQGWTIVEQLAW